MIFQFFLIIALLLILLYAFMQKNKSSLISVVTMICALAGLYFVLLPEHANIFANAIGVGRGADLILYCWVVISSSLLLNLHFKNRINMELLTAIARKVAIIEANLDDHE